MISNLPIRLKIMGIVIILLVLMIFASAVSIKYISSVKSELSQIARGLVPITEKLGEIDVNVLKQELLLEKVFTYFEVEPLPELKINALLLAIDALRDRAQAEFDDAVHIAREGLNRANTEAHIIAFTRAEMLLKILRTSYLDLNKHSMEIIKLLKEGDHEKSLVLEAWLIEAEDEFNANSINFLAEIASVTEDSVLAAEKHQEILLVLSWFTTVLAVIFGLLASAFVSARMTRPLLNLLDASKKITKGDLETAAVVEADDEIGKMTAQFNRMVVGIRQKERIKATFGQFVDPRIVNSIISNYDLDQAHRQPVTVFFSDIAGFSRISEQFTPSSMVRLVNEYLSLVSEPIAHRQGIIDKFIGDAVVAFWSTPFVQSAEGAEMCCLAALEQQRQIELFRTKVSEILGLRKDLPDIKVRMGIATSDCVVGNIGSTNSKSFTAIGPATEWAEDLENLNKKYNTEILVLEPTVKLISGKMEFRRLDVLKIGHETSFQIYELLGPAGAVEVGKIDYRNQFEGALDLLEAGDVQDATEQFRACREINPSDGAVDVQLEKLGVFQ
tara:strand:- start:2503 stop:4176 length:1674 start_codon:yes stop_codon:yes gene_type:complete